MVLIKRSKSKVLFLSNSNTLLFQIKKVFYKVQILQENNEKEYIFTIKYISFYSPTYIPLKLFFNNKKSHDIYTGFSYTITKDSNQPTVKVIAKNYTIIVFKK